MLSSSVIGIVLAEHLSLLSSEIGILALCL